MTVTIKPSDKAITTYYEEMQKYKDLGVSKETSVRPAFLDLLKEVAKKADWIQIQEHAKKNAQGRTIYPDSTFVKNGLPRGYYEAKDSGDKLDVEIRKKTEKGYPLTNIIFEDTQTAVLYQNRKETFRTAITNREELARLLSDFLSYSEPVLENFDAALANFKDRVPELARGLVKIIEEAHKKNKKFQAAFEAFYELCKTALNPSISTAAVDEMLVQHLLTERLIRKIFDNPEFTRRNVIAAEIEKVIDALVSQSFNRDEYLRSLDSFYQAIEQAGHGLDFTQKQGLLNTVYERFFQGYSVKLADTHGIVYTPQPIVDFMCASVAEVLQTEFGKSLGDDGVVILDPATGTGNFIVNLLRRVPKQHLKTMYEERLFANEIMLLPYYIAALNIEHAYYELTGTYEPFEGLCFVDTLELAEGAQMRFSFMTEQNTARVERQKKAPITVIIGNPPYNVGQESENDNNKNRKYEIVDQRVRETYARDSKATNKNALGDAYVKFFRWASDRLQGRDGVICYVSNNSFVDQVAFDGMRKHLLQDFTRVYHIDLHGNVRQNPKLSGTTHNVFGIQVGVGITLAVRSASHTERQLFYHRVPELWRKEEKLSWLTGMELTPPSNSLPASDEGELETRGWQTDGHLWTKLKPLARQMRTEPTEAEDRLWQSLRKKQQGAVKFRRQHTFERFIVDFYAPAAKLIVEVDGSIHDYTAVEDAIRQEYLESLGLKVIRFTNDQVLNSHASVLDQITRITTNRLDSPSSLAGRGLGGGVNSMIPWQSLVPDNRNTWLIPKNADEYSSFLPIGSKDTKSSAALNVETIFRLYSNGVKTNRDDVVYDFNREQLVIRIQQFIDDYNSEVDRYKRANRPIDIDSFVKYEHIKWSETLKANLSRGVYAIYSDKNIRQAQYRPFASKHLFFSDILNERRYQFPAILPTPETEQENRLIWLKVGSEWPMFALISNQIVDLLPSGGSQCFPFYTYDEDGSNRRENITDWALTQFRDHYNDPSITKWDIFYYVYGILHHSEYRTKFADNFKRELPRIPFAPHRLRGGDGGFQG